MTGLFFCAFFGTGSGNFGQTFPIISKICIFSYNSGGVRGEYRRYFTPRPVIASQYARRRCVIASQSADWRGNPSYGAAIRSPGITDSHGSDIGHCLGMTRGRAATWGGPYGMGSTDVIPCRGGYDPPGRFRSAERPPLPASAKEAKRRSRGEGFRFPSPLEKPLSLKPTKQRGDCGPPFWMYPPGAANRGGVGLF